MNRATLFAAVAICFGAALAFSGGRLAGPNFVFEVEKVNPVTHTRFADANGEFSFAIVSDRTGGHRSNIFSQAVEKLNLMQPQFVVSVGDLIEGPAKAELIPGQWQEFDGMVEKLSMPFFYVGGNHDLGSAARTKFWAEKKGRLHYHFVYRDVLFLMLNSEDPPGSATGKLGAEQIAYAKKTLADNAGVRWTIVFVHHPVWASANGAKNGWAEVEKALTGRQYTVFAGHIHRFQKFVRQGMNYYQLATTGGVSMVRGVEYGEFDHITWLTMRKDGPIIAHLRLDAVLTEDLSPIKTDEPGVKSTRKPTHPVLGKALLDGSPIPGAIVTLTPSKKDGVKCSGKVEADGSFKVSTYVGFDGAVAAEYQVTVTWRDPATGKSLLPAIYGKAGDLKTTIRAGENAVVLELKSTR